MPQEEDFSATGHPDAGDAMVETTEDRPDRSGSTEHTGKANSDVGIDTGNANNGNSDERYPDDAAVDDVDDDTSDMLPLPPPPDDDDDNYDSVGCASHTVPPVTVPTVTVPPVTVPPITVTHVEEEVEEMTEESTWGPGSTLLGYEPLSSTQEGKFDVDTGSIQVPRIITEPGHRDTSTGETCEVQPDGTAMVETHAIEDGHDATDGMPVTRDTGHADTDPATHIAAVDAEHGSMGANTLGGEDDDSTLGGEDDGSTLN